MLCILSQVDLIFRSQLYHWAGKQTGAGVKSKNYSKALWGGKCFLTLHGLVCWLKPKFNLASVSLMPNFLINMNELRQPTHITIIVATWRWDFIKCIRRLYKCNVAANRPVSSYILTETPTQLTLSTSSQASHLFSQHIRFNHCHHNP